jgi:two-component system response regulator (stage 0 sporulation protein A)
MKFMKYYDRAIQEVLRCLGVYGSYEGSRYITYAVVKIAEKPDMTHNVCKGLYKDISEHFNVSNDSVERNIRTVINIIWNRGNREMLEFIFGFHLEKRPSNTEFLDAVSKYVIHRVAMLENLSGANHILVRNRMF